ncbi:ribulokinase [Ruminococcaceae bacterium OttesenSCG-928-I18]|nr:ribulokinase [Ruminococcaceae bacterium OttesenSCG-928-I18]
MKYAVGVDFGTLSARAVVIDENGRELAECVKEYPHAVLEEALPSGEKLGVDWALQDPDDYLLCLSETVYNAVSEAGVSPEDIAGIGIDFTSCTVMPVKADGTPLCKLEKYKDEPHAWPKLWKHHAAQYCADIVNEVAERRGEEWLPYYGGKLSSEWTLAKSLQILHEAPEVYAEMDRIIEGGDWVIWQLCGREVHSECNAGYKVQWRPDSGYPSRAFLREVDPGFENFGEKVQGELKPVGARAGYVTEEMAEKCGLSTKTAVAVGIIDAHASVPACGIATGGKLLMAMGTSTCHLLLSEVEKPVPGVCGVVRGGILPGLYAYEAGQSCVGDHFSWFIDNCLPESYWAEAHERDISPHQVLREKAAGQQPGEHGLLALDWWNGVRSPLMDFDLSGVLLGLNLQTKPEDIYRALIESTAYGTRTIIEAFKQTGVPVDGIYAGGGIARKDPMAMQIYADVCKVEIQIVDSSQSGALGSAILGFAAAECFGDVYDLVRKIGKAGNLKYTPQPENAEIYEKLFAKYQKLSAYFGKGGNEVLHTLKTLRLNAKKEQ